MGFVFSVNTCRLKITPDIRVTRSSKKRSKLDRIIRGPTDSRRGIYLIELTRSQNKLHDSISKRLMLNLVKLLFAIVSALSLVSALPIIGLSKRGLSGVLTNCKKGYFALTFDDGPYQYTSELIDKLNTNGIKVGSNLRYIHQRYEVAHFILTNRLRFS